MCNLECDSYILLQVIKCKFLKLNFSNVFVNITMQNTNY